MYDSATNRDFPDITEEEFHQAESVLDLPLYQELLRTELFRDQLMEKEGGQEIIDEFHRPPGKPRGLG